jgi:predicted RNase H-like HicB family nuclease
MNYTFAVMLQREPEGGFTVTVPALPGCITYGEDLDEALAMAKEVIELFVEELKSRGEKIEDNSETLEYSVKLNSA